MENNKEVTDTNVGNIKEDIKILKEYLVQAKECSTRDYCNGCKYDNIISCDVLNEDKNKAIENVLNELQKYRHAMAMISEICIDESKLHITSAEAIEEIRKNIYHGQ